MKEKRKRSFSMNKDVIPYEENEELLLINMRTNKFYALDYMSSLIWKSLIEYQDIQEVSERISKQYSIDRHQVRSDIEHFIRELMTTGALIVHE